MSRGYKRRKKALERGTWETPDEMSRRIWSEFAAKVDAEIRRLEALPPEELERMRKEVMEARNK